MCGAGKDRRHRKFECVRSMDQLEDAVRALVCAWRVTVPEIHLPVRRREVRKLFCSLPPCDMGQQYTSYTTGMDWPPPEGRLWAPDVEARTIAWDVSEHAHLLAGLNQMAGDMTHWRQVADSPECIAELNVSLCAGLLPRRNAFILVGRRTGRRPSCRSPIARSKQSHDQSAQRRGRT